MSSLNRMHEPDIERPGFREVYEAWFDYVWRTLKRLGVREAELEDAAQEVFMVVHRRLEDYDPRRPLRPWLVGIAYKVAARERRRPRHARERALDEQMLSAQVARAPDPERVVQARQRRARVIAALDTLDADRRVIFVMHELDGIPCPEIGEALGVPLNTVYSRLRIARLRFKAALDRLRLRGGEA